MIKWTNNQQKAIDSRDGTILVSAAAGSGKTAVLVERVIQRLEDESKPCSADQMLIVTFTKAATSQMREKIASALEKRLEKDPSNEHLLKQRMLLPFARISTIDSFCGDIVRENFHDLGISPDFKMLEETELSVMRYDAAVRVVENCYKEADENFQKLLELFVNTGDDSALIDIIINLYKNAQAFPFPDQWLDSLLNEYLSDSKISQSIWGKLIIEYIGEAMDYCCTITKAAYDDFLKNDEKTSSSYEPLFKEYLSFFAKFKKIIQKADWSEICTQCKLFEPGRLKSLPRGYSSVYADRAKAVKAEVCDIVKKRIPKYLCCNEEEFQEDTAFLRPMVEKLIQIIKDFGAEFSSLKAAANGADFNDIIAFALKLLVKEVDSNGNLIKTPLAQSISSSFQEILVDEFQDINETQNLLFKAVSKNESNLFMVGDVKQSIYGFRQAMPDIFLNRRKALADYESGNYPARINLDYNFRSRKGVTDFINFVFSQIMSEKAGELDYDENEALKAGAAYIEHDQPDAQIHIINTGSKKISREDEAEYAAQYIENAIKEGTLVADGDGQRPAAYKDFCILLRSTKQKSDIFAAALLKRGIPCYVANRSGFFDATEIRTMLSIMRIVDNPLQDVALLTTLISPVFGFTPDELSKLRIENPTGPYYSCIYEGAKNNNKKCAAFIEDMHRLRALSATLGAGDFVRELFDYTGFDSIVSSMSDGSQRRANLSLLLDYAQKYEQSGHVGLSGFIRFIDRVERQKGDFEIANEISESADVVRIMSIHKSKGLEFPICILADCSGRFNDDFLKGNVLFHQKYGIAFRRLDGYRRFDTLAQRALQAACENSSRSEELRVLYVALTRAKEKIICLIREDNPEKKIEKTLYSLTNDKKIHPFKVLSSKNMGDWILAAALKHKDSALLPFVSDKNIIKAIPCESQLSFEIQTVQSSSTSLVTEKEDGITASKDILDLISKRVSYVYPYSALSGMVTKVSPSQLENEEDNMKYFASAKPSFLSEDGITAADKGTAVHKFMQFYDYTASLSVEEQAENMLKTKKLDEKEAKALDFAQLKSFFESDIAQRISKSKQLLREKKVSIAISAAEIYKDLQPELFDEKIIVQGYVDCAFEENSQWVIVDYKTDKVKKEQELLNRYSAQLKMYEKALSECTGMKVKETIIYSFHLSKSITL